MYFCLVSFGKVRGSPPSIRQVWVVNHLIDSEIWSTICPFLQMKCGIKHLADENLKVKGDSQCMAYTPQNAWKSPSVHISCPSARYWLLCFLYVVFKLFFALQLLWALMLYTLPCNVYYYSPFGSCDFVICVCFAPSAREKEGFWSNAIGRSILGFGTNISWQICQISALPWQTHATQNNNTVWLQSDPSLIIQAHRNWEWELMEPINTFRFGDDYTPRKLIIWRKVSQESLGPSLSNNFQVCVWTLKKILRRFLGVQNTPPKPRVWLEDSGWKRGEDVESRMTIE